MSNKPKVEMSQWEAGQLMEILMSLDNAYYWKEKEGVELSDNEYLNVHEDRLKDSVRKRMNNLLKKMIKAAEETVEQEKD